MQLMTSNSPLPWMVNRSSTELWSAGDAYRCSDGGCAQGADAGRGIRTNACFGLTVQGERSYYRSEGARA